MRNFSSLNTGFHQANSNAKKMCAYYTDEAHVRAIAEMFDFPDEECCCFDPCGGDANALLKVTKREERQNLKLFYSEMNRETFFETKERVGELLEAMVCTDFLRLRCSQKVFSFLFVNPPYIDMEGVRMEIKFLDALSQYCVPGAYMAWVVPFNVFISERHLKMAFGNWDVKCVYRFHDAEFAKYKQVVAIMQKKPYKMVNKERLGELMQKYGDIDSIEELPFDYTGEKFKVLPSSAEKIKTFESRDFNKEEAFRELLSKSTLSQKGSMFMPVRYSVFKVGEPPVMPKKDSMCILSYGAGFCIAGNENERHLYRGICKQVETPVINYEEGSGSAGKARTSTVTIRESVTVASKIIEESGLITTL